MEDKEKNIQEEYLAGNDYYNDVEKKQDEDENKNAT